MLVIFSAYVDLGSVLLLSLESIHHIMASSPFISSQSFSGRVLDECRKVLRVPRAEVWIYRSLLGADDRPSPVDADAGAREQRGRASTESRSPTDALQGSTHRRMFSAAGSKLKLPFVVSSDSGAVLN